MFRGVRYKNIDTIFKIYELKSNYITIWVLQAKFAEFSILKAETKIRLKFVKKY